MATSPLRAIHAHCFDCIYDNQAGNGTKHDQTESCTSYDCALYELRPITNAEKSRRYDEKLKSMSLAELEAYEANRAEKAAKFKLNISKPNTGMSGATNE